MSELALHSPWAPWRRDYLHAENLTPDIADEILLESWQDYAVAGRYHHSVGHPSWMLGYLDQHLAEAHNPRVIGWAIIMHDRVMDMLARAPENEERSAIAAEDALKDRLPGAEVDLVTAYVRASAKHRVQHNDTDLGIFLDSDRAILGAPRPVFAKYRDNVGHEMWFALQASGREMNRSQFEVRFALGTLAFYDTLRDQPIFSTPAGIEEFAIAAKENIIWDTGRMQQIAATQQPSLR